MRPLCLVLSLMFALLAFADFSRFVDGAAHRALCSLLLVCGLYCLYHAVGRRYPVRSSNAGGRARLPGKPLTESHELLRAVESLAEALDKAREEARKTGSRGLHAAPTAQNAGQNAEKNSPAGLSGKGGDNALSAGCKADSAVKNSARNDSAGLQGKNGAGSLCTGRTADARAGKAQDAPAREIKNTVKTIRPSAPEEKALSAPPTRSRRKSLPLKPPGPGRKKIAPLLNAPRRGAPPPPG